MKKVVNTTKHLATWQLPDYVRATTFPSLPGHMTLHHSPRDSLEEQGPGKKSERTKLYSHKDLSPKKLLQLFNQTRFHFFLNIQLKVTTTKKPISLEAFQTALSAHQYIVSKSATQLHGKSAVHEKQ